MERLIPNSRYKLIYKSEGAVEFQTLDQIPEAKHLIRVLRCDTNQETDLIRLLMKPWLDIVEIPKTQPAEG
jgi:hypothetical protein